MCGVEVFSGPADEYNKRVTTGEPEIAPKMDQVGARGPNP